MRRHALVQAPRLKEYTKRTYEKENYTLARQIESEYSFDGNWWYIWFKGDFPLQVGDSVFTDKGYTIRDIHVYKNYKRGCVLLED